MEQKINYQRYLLIGISILTTFLYGCQEQVEYRLDAEFIFVNQSDKTLSFSVNDPNGKRDEIILKKNASDIITLIGSEGSKVPDLETCCEGLLNSVLDGSDQGNIVIKYDDFQCLIESPANLDNYKKEKINSRYFRYTFTFTNESLKEVSECK